MLGNYENLSSLVIITHNSLVIDDIMMRKVKMLWLSGEDISTNYDSTPKSDFD